MAPMLDAAASRFGVWAGVRSLPTLAWLSASDGALLAYCAAGAVAALGLVFDLAAGPCALAAWALYLSLTGAGGEFMRFQWDALLLETGLLAVFVAPWTLRGRRTEASRGAFLLVRLLLVKLMLESAVVKLAGGDATWRSLTALEYHHWTQPLPTPLAWSFAALPAAVHRASCLAMFAVEFGAPLLLLGPRRVRELGAAAVAALMALIALSGNYGFFNLLTVVLCASALDDAPGWVARLAPKGAPATASPRRARAVGAFAALWLTVSALMCSSQLGGRPPLIDAWAPLMRVVSPLRSIDAYGLFSAMTTTRDEIVVEVSADGHEWREWPFKWKPGDPRRGGSFVAPHMPRLDWQMWFAALGAPSPWFNNLLFRLLQGSPAVEALMGPPPFGAERPVYARATLWSYRFATPAERRADGLAWRRERKGLYFPVVSLKAAP
ncbi:MAG: lipase maturation factor family protein [Elusimicrobia bacterium]|nr:lipase maturation factor family protein [Elusimicrobiota bacterium]